jgi:HAD superfamily hydrolase (TIGR01509 family)
MKHFQAIIFDMDGLLLDSEALALQAFARACQHFGLGDHSEVFMRCVGTNAELGARVLEEGLGSLVDCQAFQQRWDAYYQEAISVQPVPLKSGVLELLDHLLEADVPIAIATSTRLERARHKLQACGLLQRFKVIVAGDQVRRSKPFPDIYLRAAELLRVAPQHCLALEDSENGVRAGLAAGMTVVQIPDLVEPSAEVRALGHIVLPSLADVRAYPFRTPA